MRGKMTLVVIATVVLGTTIWTSGCTEAEREKIKAEADAAFTEREWDEAVRQVKLGLEQLDAFDVRLSEAEPESAKRHLEKMAKHFNKARTHLEKAEVGRDRQGAVDSINSGTDALNKAYQDFEEGKIDSAQSQLDRANELFAKASETLG